VLIFGGHMENAMTIYLHLEQWAREEINIAKSLKILDIAYKYYFTFWNRQYE
jgi:hypothetical protein